jgi:hypothetical protein
MIERIDAKKKNLLILWILNPGSLNPFDVRPIPSNRTSKLPLKTTRYAHRTTKTKPTKKMTLTPL